MTGITLTKRSLELFSLYALDAANWSGEPLVGGNVGGSKADRGNLTHLKQAGLITTFESDGHTWMRFTVTGKTFAAEQGIDLESGTRTPAPAAQPITEKDNTTMTTKTAKATKNTTTTTRTAKSSAAAKKAAPKTTPKTAAPKPAAVVTKPTTTKAAAFHAFTSSNPDKALVCDTCGAAPSGTLHRRHMDTIRRMWRSGSPAELADYLTHLVDPTEPALAKLTWTKLPAEIKRGLAACLPADLDAK
jgi:hypothetical protein